MGDGGGGDVSEVGLVAYPTRCWDNDNVVDEATIPPDDDDDDDGKMTTTTARRQCQ